jgi:hypothetical protein
MLMNNRFVVPLAAADNVTKFSTLQAALTAPWLNAGDIIQIEPSSSPGHIVNADMPAVQSLTLQGDAAFDLQSIPYVYLDDSVSIGSALHGLTLKHLQLDTLGGTLTLNDDATITGCQIKDDFAGTAISFQGPSAAVISDSTITNGNAQSQSISLVTVQLANDSQIDITDNQFVALVGQQITLLSFKSGAGISGLVAHNTFTDHTGNVPLCDIQNSTQGVTIQDNLFRDGDLISIGIELDPPIGNINITNNVISFPNGSGGSEGIAVDPGPLTALSSMVIANNQINTGGNGTGIAISGEEPGAVLAAKVEGNDLRGNQIGVLIGTGFGGSMYGVDLGGGPDGSVGANDFRGDYKAIYVTALASTGPISATGNIYGVFDPKGVIHDQSADPTLASVDWSGALTGNFAYVETLYLDFLHRTGDVGNPLDAGNWVTLMSQGMSAATVAGAIARSPEALGVAVDGLYHRFLGRDADQAGRAYFVNYLQNGGTLEGVSRAILGSKEYRSHFPTDSSFVQSLYQSLLHRTGSPAEIAGWVAQLPQLGRAGVAQAFLLSQEYRGDEVSHDYTQLLNRTPSAAEISSWVGSGKDLLAIDVLFAGSLEFQLNG